MEVEKIDGKMELVEIISELMPKGIPKFLDLVKYPKIENLFSELGKLKMMKVLFLMLKDFCNSINVVRNMNEDQIIEGAAMLLDECGNFRLEDYVIMFSLAKRGELIDIRDRIDIQMLSQMLNNYWQKRNIAASVDQDIKHLDALGSDERSNEKSLQFNDATGTYDEVPTLSQALQSFATGFEIMKSGIIENKTISIEEAKKQIVANPDYKNPYTN